MKHKVGRRGNNEGSILQRSDGRWMGQWTMPDGKRKVVYAKTRAECRDKLDAVHVEADRMAGLMPGTAYTTLRQFFDGWLTMVEQSRRGRTPATYRYCLYHWCAELFDIVPAKLTAAHIQQLYTKRFAEGRSGTTVGQIHRTLHNAFESAVKQGVLLRNPTDLIDAPRNAHIEQQTWSVDEARRFLEAIRGDRFEALFILALSTGMRQGEIFGLRWNAVDLERGWVQVRTNMQRIKSVLTIQDTKTAASRHVLYLPPVTIKALREHQERQSEEKRVLGAQWSNAKNLVFCSTIGTPVMQRNIIRRHFDPAIARAGIPEIRFHDMRHTCATLLLEAGMHPKVVSEMLGHSSVKVTMDLYAHATPAMHRVATSAMQIILEGDETLALPEPSNPIEQNKRRHWSVVTDIIRLMVDGDIEQAKLYAELLAQRLEEDGDSQAKWIRHALLVGTPKDGKMIYPAEEGE